MSASVTIDDSVFATVEADLKKMAAIDRNTALTKGFRKAVQIVAKRTRQKLPRPGSPGYTGGKKRQQGHVLLHKTIGTTVYEDKRNNYKITARVTYSRAKGGYHGHLVEAGFKHKRAGRTIRGQKHLEHAFKESRLEQIAAIEYGVKKALEGKS